jgi:type IV pilus assembly protein PilB
MAQEPPVLRKVDLMQPAWPKDFLGELAIKKGLITPTMLNEALDIQFETGRPLGEALLQLGYLLDSQLAELLAEHLKMPYIPVDELAFTPDQLNEIPEALARKHTVLPLRRDGKRLDVVMADPQDLDAIQEISFITGCKIMPAFGARSKINESIDRYYTRHLEGAGALMAAGATEPAEAFNLFGGQASVLDASSEIDAPVIQLLNLIMRKAIQMGASDIHIEPGIEEGTVRFRLDGLLADQLKVPTQLHTALISRLKILGRMDIAERRLPQDGSVRVKLEGREADLRLSTIPLRSGEKAVIRILDATGGAFELDTIGFSTEDLPKVDKLIHRHMGMIIMTGPTGSGKTTTLYSMLNRIKARTINIVTVEDPIEYHYPGLNQMQVNADIKLTFATGLRSILRQDPDVILVGEIRDMETAEIACRAALTGHLVFTTLHTNDAPSSITRLLDIGIPRYLVASVIIGIIAQRLVRRICPECSASFTPDAEQLANLGLSALELGGTTFQAGRGCHRCHDVGYKGRMGVFETLIPNSRIRDQILRGATEEDIRLAAQENGMRTLVEDGLEKARRGETTLDELGRVLEVGEYAATCCTGCGRQLNSAYRFCPYCGSVQRRICLHCGSPIHSGWKVCANCGSA